ncbi:hypothetical protein ACFZBP_25980 [Streptomyces sp. NPDC008086]|uniref:tetratricopeptide repeat protein n=1 Tax=Streptomyces sp. NPDC008086 TaxID=3364807 RepID=UPI0036EAACD5
MTAGRDVGVAVTGDHNHILLAPAVRSAYWEQVRRIAPPELVGRAAELADLAAFCTADSGPTYAWWRAEAWAGKTALMSWFALHPPRGVRVVPFFVTARLGAQNDVVAYVDVVLEQLADLVGEGLPAQLTEATREAHLLHLYGVAARVCAERGERLLLLVDGLDEDRGVTTGPDAHSIASLLPARPEAGMRVLVSGRLNPPLPGDVPGDHPLCDPVIARTLTASSYAQAIRAEAERELKHLIAAGGLEYDLLALVTAAGGGLAAEDLAELTGAVPYRVRDVLRTRAGRTFGVRVNVYLLGHEELQAQAQEMLGAAELGRYRGKLHDWAETWRERGWPQGTPEYLLRGYFRMLRAGGDLPRMIRCGLDATRQERMLVATGGDASAVNEIHATEELILEGGAHMPLESLRLAIRRDRLGDRSAGIPDSLPHAWAVAGQPGRALALARSFPDAHRRGMALAGIAHVLLEREDSRDAGLELVLEAEQAARQSESRFHGDVVWSQVILLLVRAGLYERAATVVRAADPRSLGSHPYVTVVQACTAAGRWDLAEALARDAPDGECRSDLAIVLVSARARAGRVPEAEAMARSGEPTAWAAGLIAIASALRAAGSHRRADALCAEVEAAIGREGAQPGELVKLLARAGEFDRAETIVDAMPDGEKRAWAVAELVESLAEAGELDRAEALLGNLRPDTHVHALRNVSLARARAGRHAQAEALARAIPGSDAAEALCSVVGVMAEAGEYARAETLARTLDPDLNRSSAFFEIVKALARAGEVDRARALGESFSDPVECARAQVEVATALAYRGRRTEAVEALLDVEGRTRVLNPPTAARKIGSAAKALADAGHRRAALNVLDGAEALIAGRRTEAGSLARAESVMALQALVSALVSTGQMEKAEAIAKSVPADDASDNFDRKDLLSRVVQGCARTGEWARAEAVMRAEAELDSGLEGIAPSLDSAFARGLVEAGHFAQAEAHIRAITRPRWLRASELGRLAWAMAGARRSEQARLLLDEVIVMEDAHPTMVDMRVWVETLDAAGDRAAAEALFEETRPSRAEPNGYLAEWERTAVAETLCVLGRVEEAVEELNCLTDQYERAQGLAALVGVLVESGQFVRAEDVARTISAPGPATDACVRIAAATTDAEQARRLTALALQSGGWVPALPALLKHTPETVPLVVEAASAMKAECRHRHELPTAARTSSPSSN